jgi:hypothetical protein
MYHRLYPTTSANYCLCILYKQFGIPNTLLILSTSFSTLPLARAEHYGQLVYRQVQRECHPLQLASWRHVASLLVDFPRLYHPIIRAVEAGQRPKVSHEAFPSTLFSRSQTSFSFRYDGSSEVRRSSASPAVSCPPRCHILQARMLRLALRSMPK